MAALRPDVPQGLPEKIQFQLLLPDPLLQRRDPPLGQHELHGEGLVPGQPVLRREPLGAVVGPVHRADRRVEVDQSATRADLGRDRIRQRVEHGQHVVDRLPDAKLYRLPGESHLAGLGRAEEILHTMVELWDTIEKG